MLWKTGRSNEGTKTEARAKVIQLDEGFHVLKPDRRVVDLGCALGGLTQVVVERVCAGRPLAESGVEPAAIETPTISDVRLWLLADIHPHPELRPLYPRKQT
jgi:23S rRNA U2552 (ribose-2'-O)-methylase RlmE/FtsJ